MTKEVNEVHWMDIKSVARELSTGDRIVSTSDVLQWCGNKTLKVSCYLFNKLARPQHEYCPLLEDGYYQLIARKIIQVEESQLVSEISNPLSNTVSPIENYDFRSSEFNNMVKKRASEHDKKILIKAKDIFKRWKSRGGFRVRHSYGNNTMLDGVYSFYIDKELSNWMKRKALGYEVTPIKSLHVTDEEGAIFQIIDSNGEPETFELRREDLIVTKDALAAFEKKSGSKLPPKDRANELRIIDLKAFINELAVLAKATGAEFDPFDMKCSKDMLLSAIQDWEKERVPNKEKRNWNVSQFPKKTWEHIDRKDICNNFQNKNNSPDPNYFKKIKLK